MIMSKKEGFSIRERLRGPICGRCIQFQAPTGGGKTPPNPSFAVQSRVPGLIPSVFSSSPIYSDDPGSWNKPEEGAVHVVDVEIETQKGEVITRGYIIN